MCRGNNLGQSLSLSLIHSLSLSQSLPHTAEYFSWRAFMRRPQVCYTGGLCSSEAHYKTEGQKIQTHWPVWDSICPAGYKYVHELWCAQWRPSRLLGEFVGQGVFHIKGAKMSRLSLCLTGKNNIWDGGNTGGQKSLSDCKPLQHCMWSYIHVLVTFYKILSTWINKMKFQLFGLKKLH